MKRKNLSPKQKFGIVLESLQKDNVAQTARQYGINPNLISTWRKRFLDYGHEIFSQNSDQEKRKMLQQINRLEQIIGKKEIEINLLQNFFDEYQSPNGR